LERLGLAERQLQGGEGVIVNVTEDIKGKVYTVKIHRGGRTRLARLEDLVVRRKGKR
jgi:RIO-like serine/threonine protein kinase